MKSIQDGREYFAAISNEYGAREHSHIMVQIYIRCGENGKMKIENDLIEGNCIIVDTNVKYTILDNHTYGFVMLFDPIEPVGYTIRQTYLHTKNFMVLDLYGVREKLMMTVNKYSEKNMKELIVYILDKLMLQDIEKPPYDERINEALKVINNAEVDFSLSKLSSKLYISKSRLAHLFKKQTGIPLKNYLQFKRLELACRMLIVGSSITDAAIETGFNSSSHIANANKLMTG